MAKKVYVGVNNVARQVKKMYVGVNDKARKVKKGYIGVGGVARPFFSSEGSLVYYGKITNLSVARTNMATATTPNGNYALFAGGALYPDLISGFSSTVDAYNTSLVRSTPTALDWEACNIAATTAGTYTLFAGGYKWSDYASYFSNVAAYNSSLTRSNPTSLSVAKQRVGSATIGGYAIFGGGNEYNSSYENTGLHNPTVDSYNSSLTRSQLTNLDNTSVWADTSGVSLENYGIIFADKIYAYNASLTRTTPTDANYVGSNGHGFIPMITSAGVYAVGQIDGTMCYYTNSLTRGTLSQLSVTRSNYAMATAGNKELGQFAIIAGGQVSTGTGYSGTVEVYNQYLTRSTFTSLTDTRTNHSGVSIGNYALFGGGNGYESGYSWSQPLNTVEAFTVL